ncbi:exodeoxyribonuclease VII small subunit [Parafrankia discariae]|uniref:exodeoxyribonuclease VII small subunit n=1 Tax=Parafrankia discariae TaxID=365528 RepID=UPI00039CE4C3|nr:exodeoxyribonuclease VII small subunit [Parafrankia discariae]
MTDPDRQRSPAVGPDSDATAEATSGLTFEAARAELEDVVRRLEAGGCALEESLALWERGEELAALCQRLLDGARARLTPASAADPS